MYSLCRDVLGVCSEHRELWDLNYVPTAGVSRKRKIFYERREDDTPLTCSFFPPRHHQYRRLRRRRRTVSDVLGAPTDDQVDIGSGVGGRHEEENAQTVRHRYNDGAGASLSVGMPASEGGAASSTAAARVAGKTTAFDKVIMVRARSARPCCFTPLSHSGVPMQVSVLDYIFSSGR